MLNFAIYDNGQPAEQVDLRQAFVVGSDDVPLRAEIKFEQGVIRCLKRAAGPAGLALVWESPKVGRLLVETVRVPERERPYVLTVELARRRMLRIHQKIEEWGMLDHPETADVQKAFEEARDILIRALQADDESQAAAIGDEALSAAMEVSERLARLHAEIFLNRRKAMGNMAKRTFGCQLDLEETLDKYRSAASSAFDYVQLPLTWRHIEPSEQKYNWKPVDAWIEWLTKHKVPVTAGPLLRFTEEDIPEWLRIWEHDFETIRDLAHEHIKRVVTRYGQYVQQWIVAEGLHAPSMFSFSFEQLMELSRMATATVKQAAARSQSVVSIAAPWGEYYAHNQRTIPPTLYADMILQNGLNFDALALRFNFAVGTYPQSLRDMFEISSIIDLYGKLGKPLHLVAVQVPSGDTAEGEFGYWRGGWDERVQAEWLHTFVQVALSKPYVEKISWHTLLDGDTGAARTAGLICHDFAPKKALQSLAALRKDLSRVK